MRDRITHSISQTGNIREAGAPRNPHGSPKNPLEHHEMNIWDPLKIIGTPENPTEHHGIQYNFIETLST